MFRPILFEYIPFLLGFFSLANCQFDRWFDDFRVKAVRLNETHMRMIAQVPTG